MMYLLAHFVLLRLFLLEFFAAKRSQTRRSTGPFTVFKIIFVVCVVGVIDYCGASFRGTTSGGDILGLEDGLEKGVGVLSDARGIAGQIGLRGCHDDKGGADSVMT